MSYEVEVLATIHAQVLSTCGGTIEFERDIRVKGRLDFDLDLVVPKEHMENLGIDLGGYNYQNLVFDKERFSNVAYLRVIEEEE